MTVLHALNSHTANSGLIYECHQRLNQVATHNQVTIKWIKGHSDYRGNDAADKLASRGSSMAAIGPEPIVPLPFGYLRNLVSNLAPISKKFGAGSTGKSGAGSIGKSGAGSLGKSGAGGLGKSGTTGFGKSAGSKISSSKSSSSTPKLPSGFGSSSGGKSSGSSSSKSYGLSPFSTPKEKSSKTGFGIIWIPTRKNKKKEVVYSGVNDKYPKGKYERSPSMYRLMSGDSPDFQPHKKKEEETELLMPDRTKVPIASIATAGTALGASELPSDSTAVDNADEKEDFIRRDNKEDSKEAAGDTNKKDLKSEKSEDYLENDKIKNKPEKGEKDTEKFEDKVDSVYLRPPPAHKARSTATVEEEEDCGIKCLYYTIQCCDCVLM